MVRAFLVALLVLPCGVSLAQDPADGAAGLWNDAVLYRDEWGVPHIFADNPRAMAFAFGYAQAQDHLEPMLLAYRLANGRASEVLGPETADADRLSIRLNHAGLAREAYHTADAVTRDLCEGFALGVNTWITEHPDEAPPWADGVYPADVLALLHRYLLSQAPFDFPDALHLLPGTPSANAWAVGPTMSQTREPMLVINPHANYESAFQWYEAHLVTRDMNVYGATLFGLPVIMQGHNSVLGWALAPNAPDIADVYVELGEPAAAPDPNSVFNAEQDDSPGGVNFLDNESRSFFVATEHGFAENFDRFLTTARGPVVGESDGHPLSWRVGGYRDFGALRQLYDMGLAQDLDEFNRVLDRMQLSTFHTLYADAAGNIAYRYNATTGTRMDPATAAQSAGLAMEGDAGDLYTMPLSTAGNRFEWGAPLTPDAMPWILNPASGYVQACGTPPWLATSPAVLDASAFPAWLIRDGDSYRAKRVRRLFSIGPRSFEDMQAMLFDTVSPLAAEAVPYLLAQAEAYPDFVDNAHPDLSVMLDILRDWNFLAEPGSMAMTCFHVWWSLLRLDDDGNPWPNELVHSLIQEDATWFKERALSSAAEAAQLLRNQYQSMNVAWGDVHVIVRGQKEYPLAGGHSGDPLFYTGDRLFDDGKWRVNEGYGFAMAVRFGQTPEAVSLVPFGSSENPASPHYDDQLALMLGRRFKVARFDRGDVERHTKSAFGRRLLLRPARQSAQVFLAADLPMDARLKESAAPPAALPEGLAAFTTYIEPLVDPVPGGLSIEFDVRVHESVCAAKDFESLYLYGYHPVDGWRQLEDQQLEGDRRALTGLLGRGEVVAVLGPEAARLADPALVRPAETRRAPAQSLIAKSEDGGALPVAENGDAELTDLDPADEERVAALAPPAPRVLVPSEDYREYEPQVPDNIRLGPRTIVVPAVPPGFRVKPIIPPPTVVPQARNPFAPAGPQFFTGPLAEEVSPPGVGPDPDAAAEAQNAAPEDVRSAGPAPALAAEELVPIDSAPAEAPPSAIQSAPAAERAPRPAPVNAPPARTGGVVFSGQTPREMLAASGAAPAADLVLAPDPRLASPLQFGRSMELRTPDGAATFSVRSRTTMRGQAYQRGEPPAPYPAGLVAFSEVYETLVDPKPEGLSVALTIHIAPEAAAAERLGELTLYTFDPAQGWQPLDRFRVNVETRRFSGMDLTARTYAVLGPPAAAAPAK